VDLLEDGGSDDGYVLVKQEDVVDGMTSFMAACLVSIKKTKVVVFFTRWDHHAERGVSCLCILYERCFTYLMCEFHVYAGPAP
jgi:K+ transporter